MPNAYEQLASLELEALSEEERQSAIHEVRAQIRALGERGPLDVASLNRKIALLKIWQELARMRVSDLRADREPPFERPPVARLFGDEEAQDSSTPAETQEEAQPHVSDAPAPEAAEGLIMVRLLEAGVVRGMKLPAGITIETSEEDADHLVETGKAIRVGPAEPDTLTAG